jgi:hypothetical protein
LHRWFRRPILAPGIPGLVARPVPNIIATPVTTALISSLISPLITPGVATTVRAVLTSFIAANCALAAPVIAWPAAIDPRRDSSRRRRRRRHGRQLCRRGLGGDPIHAARRH